MLKKLIKSKACLCFLTMLVCCLSFQHKVYAAGVSVKANAKKVYVGDTITFTVSVSGGAGNITVSGAANDYKWFDNSSSTYSVKASAVGTVTLSAKGVVADYDTEKDQNVSASYSVNVVERPSTGGTTSNSGNSGSTNNGTTTPPKEDTRSKDNNLSSLTVSQGTLSPKFDAATKSYSVNLTSDISDITIDAKAKDSKAKVSGIGKKSIVIGSQTFEVIVTAENGSKKTYIITVDVSEKPTVFTKLGDSSLGLLIDISKVKAPEGYKGESITLEDTTIQGWTNEASGLTLVYLMDEDGNKNFYIYEGGKVTKKYETVEIKGTQYVLLDIPSDMEEQVGLTKNKVKFGDLEIEGWSYNDEKHQNYSVVYLMNEAGEKNLYSYESTEGTLQKYVPFELSQTNTLTYVFIGTTVLFALTSIGIAISFMRFKKKSISAIKDYYDRKNQG